MKWNKAETNRKLHRKGGGIGANQYGVYQVRHASSKQVMFIKTLLEQKAHDIKEVDYETLNVQGARDLITKLLSLPLKQGYVMPPTERQVSFAKKLIQDKEGGLELLNATLNKYGKNTLDDLSREAVSEIINSLIKKVDTPIKITEVGAYLYDETIYSIRKGVQSGKWQVWVYNEVVKTYIRNDKLLPLLKVITPDNRLTLEQAIQYSAQTGVCCHCGRTLTLLKSVASGMGAVCAKKYH